MADALARSLRRLATSSERKAPERAAAVVDDLKDLLERELGAIRAEVSRLEERIDAFESRLTGIDSELAALRDRQAHLSEDAAVAQVTSDDLGARTLHLEAEVGLMRDAMSAAAALARDSRRRVVRLESRPSANGASSEVPLDTPDAPLV
jgi:chromosome segregation ATPase